jgi:hypothetical protein
MISWREVNHGIQNAPCRGMYSQSIAFLEPRSIKNGLHLRNLGLNGQQAQDWHFNLFSYREVISQAIRSRVFSLKRFW